MEDPEVHAAFSVERARPFHDLLAQIPAPGPGVVVDLGCGPGGLTERLAQHWPFARVLGIDSSPAMIEAARKREQPGRLEFVRSDLHDWEPAGDVDVIVSNAALHRVPDHRELLPRWVEWLAPGGWLALQVPGMFDAPIHTLLREVAAREPYASALAAAGMPDGEGRPRVDRPHDEPGGGASGPVTEPEEYLRLLVTAGCLVDVWETTYLHLLDPEGRFGEDAVLAWAKGTVLRPVLAALVGEPAICEAFVEDYAELLRQAYPRYLYGTPLPYRRIFAVAGRP